jgi:hypothetical protein
MLVIITILWSRRAGLTVPQFTDRGMLPSDWPHQSATLAADSGKLRASSLVRQDLGLA